MTHRTKTSELRDRIKLLGGTPKGRTVAQLLDELEHLEGSGEAVPYTVGGLTDEDMDDIFAEIRGD